MPALRMHLGFGLAVLALLAVRAGGERRRALPQALVSPLRDGAAAPLWRCSQARRPTQSWTCRS